jgi:hypothetical protein
MFCKSGRIFAGPWENVQQATQTKLFQFFSTLGKGEDEGEVFLKENTLLCSSL